MLTDKTGVVLDVAEASGGGTSGAGSEGPTGREYQFCHGAVGLQKTALVVTRSCSSQRTSCSYAEKAIPTIWTETERVTVTGEKLTVSTANRVVTGESSCTVGNDGEGD